MSPIMMLVAAVLVLVLFMAMGMPIGFAMAVVGVGGLALYSGLGVATGILSYYPFDFASLYSFSVVPMFIYMGQIAFNAGFTSELYACTRAWLGRIPGGLVLGTIAGCAAFSACSGSSLATAAAMGKISIPEMRRYGYSRQIAAGSVAAGGTLGILIPPSIFLVIYGVITETSIGRLLIGGVIPGLLSAGMFMLAGFIRCSINPRLGPPVHDITWRERFSSVKGIWGVAAISLMVLGSIYAGVATPTEAASVGAIGVILLATVTRRLTMKNMKEALRTTIYSSTTIFVIALGAMLMIPFFTVTNASEAIARSIMGLNIPPLMIVLVLCPFYIILGMFIDSLSIMLITLPVIFPTIMALGLDPVWFGIIQVKFIELGLITPPVGMNLYVIRGISPECSMGDIYRGVIWFVLADFCTLALLILFPSISLMLPNLMK